MFDSLRPALLAGLFVATCVGEAVGQEEPAAYLAPIETEAVVTPEKIEQLRREMTQSADLPEASKQLVNQSLESALADLQLAADLSAKGAALSADVASVPERVAKLRGLLDAPPSNVVTPDAPTSLPELEQLLAKSETQHAAQKKALAAATAEPAARAERRKEIRARLVSVQESLAAVSVAPSDAATAPDLNLAITNSRCVEAKARRVAMEQELLALESELAKYDAEDAADLLRIRADVASRALLQTERVLQQVKDRVTAARESAAEDSVRKARIEAIVATPALKAYAKRNHELTEKTRSGAHDLHKAEQDLKSAQDAFERLGKQFRLTKKKVDTVGLTSSVGALLRKQSTALPDTRERRAAVLARRSLIDETQYQLFEYQAERDELGDIEAVVQEIVAEAVVDSGSDKSFLEGASREALSRKREYLDSLIKTTNQYFDALIELDTTDQQVIKLSSDYGEFIDERVLWIRSGKTLTKDFGIDASDAWLVSPGSWLRLGTELLNDARSRLIAYGAATCLLFYVIVRGRRLRSWLTDLGVTAEKANCRSIRPTIDALVATLLISIVWPIVLLLVAWRVGRIEDAFAAALSQGLIALSLLWAPLEFFRQLCRPKGLGESHFGWPSATTQAIRRRVRWFTFVGLPFAFVNAVLFASDESHGHDSIERVFFIAGIGVLAVFVFRMTSPNGLLRGHIAYHPGGWIDRLKGLWPWLAASGPVTLSVLAFTGYYYTAQVLSWRLFATVCFVISLVIIQSALLRLLMLRRRNLSIEQARERAAAAAAAAEGGDTAATSPVAALVSSTPQVELTTHSQQTRRLVTTGMFAATAVGLWLIWVQVLPALTMLDRYPLWGGEVVAAATQMTNPSPLGGMPASGTPNSGLQEPSGTTLSQVTTLSDLALALLVGFVTFVLARNGPGLLEISVLQQLPLDASVRYAITSLVSYAIVLIGVIASCSTIGLEWSQVQWLATALTFGLAFGLQEMFANFVAGLIILLERPIRVGDVVTVDDVTGVVSRIRIRATSITNWDRKEYIVPNKEFITGRLLNWTLSDNVNRIVINVGVAYGSDTERVRELLLTAANDHPQILKDPVSVATFEGFGDNSLNFVLRTYLATMDDRLATIHSLHTEINKAFRAEGIEIAFPQRDLHIRSTPAALGLALNEEQQAPSESKEAA